MFPRHVLFKPCSETQGVRNDDAYGAKPKKILPNIWRNKAIVFGHLHSGTRRKIQGHISRIGADVAQHFQQILSLFLVGFCFVLFCLLALFNTPGFCWKGQKCKSQSCKVLRAPGLAGLVWRLMTPCTHVEGPCCRAGSVLLTGVRL